MNARAIVIDSYLLTKLSPGDSVLADRGYTMKFDFEMYGVNRIEPAFTNVKKLTADNAHPMTVTCSMPVWSTTRIWIYIGLIKKSTSFNVDIDM